MFTNVLSVISFKNYRKMYCLRTTSLWISPNTRHIELKNLKKIKPSNEQCYYEYEIFDSYLFTEERDCIISLDSRRRLYFLRYSITNISPEFTDGTKAFPIISITK